MARDMRLSRMLHALIHMDQLGGAVTSERLAEMLCTNPVVVRRMMAGLRAAGQVASEKGHGGGWRLARPLSAITLRDVHAALGAGGVFALGPADDAPQCRVERTVNRKLAAALAEAEAVLLARLEAVTLADVAAELGERPVAGPGQAG